MKVYVLDVVDLERESDLGGMCVLCSSIDISNI